jgi:hypothetical protein
VSCVLGFHPFGHSHVGSHFCTNRSFQNSESGDLLSTRSPTRDDRPVWKYWWNRQNQSAT